MKVSAAKKAQNREAILRVAERLLREKGPSGVGVAEVMAGAGMTHGGFYGHFTSREELNAVAITQALQRAACYLAKVVSDGGLEGFTRQYLDKVHLKDVSRGCPIAATATEIPRQPAPIRAAFAKGLRDYLEAGIPEGTDRADALSRHCSLIGALILARAVADHDRTLAGELLLAVQGS
ncbi:MAG: TetR family transcriptional regulator [Tagaea sp. CACIAM 22H2]|nr:TetR family transcriptional regulator [Tagaea sp. CACIAM 22H2]